MLYGDIMLRKWLITDILALVTSLAALILIFVGVSRAERKIGHDFLGAQQKNFRVSNVIGPIEATGHLDWTFGVDTTKVRILLEKATPRVHRVHLLNTVCVRNGNCGVYEPLHGFSINSLNKAIENKNKNILNHVRARTSIYRNFFAQFPGIKPLLSPALEHNLTSKAYRVLADTVLEVWPDVQLVNSPLSGHGERYRGAWIEAHGSTPNLDADINSTDGTDVTDIDVDKWLERTKNERITFAWTRSYNCRHQGDFEDPRKRTSCPKKYQFEELYHITDRRAPAPQFTGKNCPKRISFAPPFIWKPFAEDGSNIDKRANYPVAITKYKTNPLLVLAHNGVKVGELAHYGNYQNLERHYSNYQNGSGVNGYAFEKRAAALGSPWVWVKGGNECAGPFVPGRRAGVYK